MSVSLNRLPQAVKPGDTLFLNDGLIQLEVVSVDGNDVTCRVVVGGELRSRKGLNLPGIDLGISAFTEADHECLKFAAEQGVDAVSQSFVECGQRYRGGARSAAERSGYHPFIIAKIERSGALDHIDDILDAADGIMVARGDLGVEIPIEEIAVVQKASHARRPIWPAKPVITATQMLESMTDNRRPDPRRGNRCRQRHSRRHGLRHALRRVRHGEVPGGGGGDAGKDRGSHRASPGSGNG